MTRDTRSQGPAGGASAPPTLQWIGGVDGRLTVIDQTRLPAELVQIDLDEPEQVWEAIRALRVRGAPAIGVAAAYGIVLGARRFANVDRPALDRRVEQIAQLLASSRPTAVNLFSAIDRMRGVLATHGDCSAAGLAERLLEEARAIERADREMCERIGRYGEELLKEGSAVLTHCNAGSLATAGDGTALSVIYAAVRAGKRIEVYVDETRPLYQGARLTAWELTRRGIPTTLICDSAAGWILREGQVDIVLTGADRIAANGDAANKIGTYSLALLARAHGVPFYVAAPSTTFDLTLPGGNSIPIEERSADEVVCPGGLRIAPEDVRVRNPAFDVTPAELIAGIITERGVIRPVSPENVRRLIEE